MMGIFGRPGQLMAGLDESNLAHAAHRRSSLARPDHFVKLIATLAREFVSALSAASSATLFALGSSDASIAFGWVPDTRVRAELAFGEEVGSAAEAGLHPLLPLGRGELGSAPGSASNAAIDLVRLAWVL